MKTSDVISNIDIDKNGGCQSDTDMNYKPSEMDHEVQMARSELYRAANSAIELHKMLRMISEKQGIEGWVAAKITKAADYLESVYHYLDYEMRFADDDLGEQATIGTTGTSTATSTPGMVKMAKVGPDGKPIGTPIMVKSTEITGKQSQGMKVIGEMASAGSSSAGGIASNSGNGFKNGGPGTLARAKQVKGNVGEGETGPKFTGYYKGTDKGRPGKKMVGSD
jgi:hypothetical protein